MRNIVVLAVFSDLEFRRSSRRILYVTLYFGRAYTHTKKTLVDEEVEREKERLNQKGTKKTAN